MKTLLKVVVSVLAIYFIVVVGTLTFLFAKKVWFPSDKPHGQYLAVLDISGIILNANRFVKDINELLENKAVKGLVVRINSPGGLVAPSQEMFDAIKKADQKIPVVISMGSLAASGGYYAALGGRKIFASPGTLTGSIGVIMEFVNTEGLYRWAKVERYTLKAGRFKDAGTPLRNMTPLEKELFNSMLSNIHEQFRTAVKERRKISSKDALDSVADGRVFTGAQAKGAKLIDDLGGFDEASKEAKKLAGLPEDALLFFPQQERGRGVLRELLFGEDEELDSLTNIGKAFSALAPSSGPAWKVMWMAPLQTY